MNSTRKPHRLPFLALCVLAAVNGLLLFFAMRAEFDNTIGHFARDAVCFHVFLAVSFLGLALTLCLCLIRSRAARAKSVSPTADKREATTGAPQPPAPASEGEPAPSDGRPAVDACSRALTKEEKRPTAFGTMITNLFSGTCAVGLFVYGILSILDVLRTGQEGSAASFQTSLLLPLLLETVTLPAAALFFYKEAGLLKSGGSSHALAGMGAVLSVTCTLFRRYFDFTLPMNSPIRNALIVAEACLLLYFLSQTRTILQRNTPAFFTFATGCTLFLSGSFSFGLLLTFLLAPDQCPNGVSLLRCFFLFFSACSAASLFAAGKVPVAPPAGEKDEKKEKKAQKEKTASAK